MATSLRELFQELDKPPREVGGPLHAHTARVGQHGHRIGKDPDGSPLILLMVEPERGARTPDIRLENLQVLHDVTCRVWSTSARTATAQFTVVRCSSPVEDVRQYFLHVMEPFLALLGRNPTPRIVSQMVDHLVEVFRALASPPRGSVQGLWAELLVIVYSSDPLLAVQSWHGTPEETFDFATKSQRVEVKSCSGGERRHTFSLEQLRFPPLTAGFVASVLAQRAGGGTSVAGLADRARALVAGHPELMARIDKTVALTLGESSTSGLGQAFNEDHALSSLRFFDATTIPRPGDIPASITRVQFEVDLSDLTPLSHRQTNRDKGLLGAIAPPNSS